MTRNVLYLLSIFMLLRPLSQKQSCLLTAILLLHHLPLARADENGFKELRRFDAPEASQAVAVDAKHFYAIGSDVIAKYDKETGKQLKSWRATKELPLTHLNSCVVLNGKLYCANSNYPEFPEASSIEIWDCETLEHVDTHSLGIYEGSLTWIDWHDDSWWAGFAHYSEKVNDNPHAKDHRWTSVVRFDSAWRRTAGWTFPKEVLDRFSPHSCSGATWGADNRLYCTGHDRGEVYCLKRPRSGPALELLSTWKAPITGQGIAWDRDRPGVLFGIDRPKKQVVEMQAAGKK